MGELAGRRALITGGGRGIGAAIAEAFATEGARLFLASRTASELDEVAAGCRERGAECTIATVDVAAGAAVTELVRLAAGEMGGLDVLVNAAGIYGPIGPFVDNDLAAWEHAVAVNLMGTVYACHTAIPLMAKAGGGSIINFSGGGATAALPRFSVYAATKAAVVRLTETLAHESRDAGIRVNAIAPGAVDTRLQDEVLAAGDRAGELHGRIRDLRDEGRGGTPASVPAELAVFLASDRSAGLTGRLLSAPHDPWRTWGPEAIARFEGTDWFTLRRIDPHTLSRLPDL